MFPRFDQFFRPLVLSTTSFIVSFVIQTEHGLIPPHNTAKKNGAYLRLKFCFDGTEWRHASPLGIIQWAR
jgi:hypothetical protein